MATAVFCTTGSEESSAPSRNNALKRKKLQGSFLLFPFLSLWAEALLDASNSIYSQKKWWTKIFVVEKFDKQKEKRA